MHLKAATLADEPRPNAAAYPFNLKFLEGTRRIEIEKAVTFFVGDNGSGKSTLLRALARKCGVFIWGGFEELKPPEREFLDALNVEWAAGPVPGSFFSSELFHNFARIVEEWEADSPGMLDYFGGKSLVSQSHGQALMSFFRGRYRIPGLYFLDEPETALTPRGQIELAAVLDRMSRDGHAQFIIASHSPILLACPGARLLSFDGPAVLPVEYEETEYYRLYRDFLADRSRFFA